MADYYAKQGAGAGDGSVALPWGNLDTAVAGISAGDTLWASGNFVLGTDSTGQLDLTTIGGVPAADLRVILRGWDGISAATDGIGYFDCNGLAGLFADSMSYLTLYHLDVSNSAGLNHYCIHLGTQNICFECIAHDVSGTGASAIASPSTNYTMIDSCHVYNTVRGIWSGNSATVRNCMVSNHSDWAVYVPNGVTVGGCTTISGGGDGLTLVGDGNNITHNTIVGDGATANINGVELGTGAESNIVMNNIIRNWSGTGNVGYLNPAGNSGGVAGYNNYLQNTTDESGTADLDLYFSQTGSGPGVVIGGVSSGETAPTAAENATAVHAKLLADEAGTAGSLAERLTRIPNAAPAAVGGLGTVDANNRVAGIQGTVANTLDEIAGAGFSSAFALDQAATLTEQYAEIKKLFDTEAWSELTGVPGATPTTADVLMWLYMMARNALSDDRLTGQQTVSNDAGASIGTASRSDDGDTFTRDKFTAS